MRLLFSGVVADSARCLASDLGAVARQAALQDELSTRSVLALDTAGAETVGCQSQILPEVEGDTPTAWYVFARHPSGLRLYELSGVISTTTSPDDFVETAYSVILRRGVDEAGRAAYQPRIAAGSLTRRALLKTLAGSREAMGKGLTLLIAPQSAGFREALPADGPGLTIVQATG